MIPPRYSEPNVRAITESYRELHRERGIWLEESLKMLNWLVLDIGCGNGDVTAILADNLHNSSIIGIDNDLRAIEIARRDSYRPSITYQKGDVCELECMDANLIFCTDSLHHFPLRKSLVSMIGTLKQGGILMIRDVDRTHIFEGNAGELMKSLVKTRAENGELGLLNQLEQLYGNLEHPHIPGLISKMAAYTKKEVVDVLKTLRVQITSATNLRVANSSDILMGIQAVKMI